MFCLLGFYIRGSFVLPQRLIYNWQNILLSCLLDFLLIFVAFFILYKLFPNYGQWRPQAE